MSILNIRKAGDDVLKQKALPIEKIDGKIKTLLDNMADTMYHAQGVGLAAPQVGRSLRLVVIDIGTGLIELINPTIIESSGLILDNEGCLSVPNILGEVERFETVTVEALNRSGKKICIKDAKELLARALQHEIDHLDGILFIEKAQSLRMGEVENNE